MKFKKVATSIFVLSLIVIAFAAPTIVAAASPAPVTVSVESVPAAPVYAPVVQEEESNLPSLGDLAETAKTLGGFALLFAALFNAGKFVAPNKFPNGSAPTYSLVFQGAILVGLIYLQLTGKADLVPVFDGQAGALANTITGLLALAVQIYGARLGHQEILAGLPVIGTSYSGHRAGEGTEVIVESTNNFGSLG